MIRSFAVPVLISNSLKLASSEALRVILYIMSNTNELPNIVEIAEAVAVSQLEAKEAISFWIAEGVLKSDFTVVEADSEEKLEAMRRQLVSTRKVYKTEEIVLLCNENPEIAEVREMAEGLKGKPLTHKEINDILVLTDFYSLSTHFLMTVIGYCMELGRNSVNEVRGCAENFFVSGVDETTIDAYIADKLDYHRNINKVKALIGASPDQFAGKDAKMLGSWISEFNMPNELIVYAYEITRAENKGEYNLRYQNKIMKEWDKKGIRTMTDAKAYYETIKSAGPIRTKTIDTTSTQSIYRDIEEMLANKTEEKW